MVRARRVDAVLVGDDLPELGADLVAALAALDVDDLAHGCLSYFYLRRGGAFEGAYDGGGPAASLLARGGAAQRRRAAPRERRAAQ